MSDVVPRDTRIAYLVHDLTDHAVHRRRAMFRAGGARVSTAGFHRRPLSTAETEVTGLGQTFDANFRQRLLAVAGWLFRPAGLKRLVEDHQVVVARNLEMLLLARIALIGRPAVPLVYECLDLHRLMLGRGAVSVLLRGLERWLMRRVSTVIVSSPAFERFYFERHHADSAQVVLVENRIVALDAPLVAKAHSTRTSPPWRIGWFGMIRCRRSLAILADVAGRSGGQVEVVIRGRPSPDIFADLSVEVEALPGVRFEGAYGSEDLETIYSEVDFVWAIDFFEAGLNSSWLLPNRLYEGSAFGRPIIAQQGVETARWLSMRGAGVIVNDHVDDLTGLFRGLTPQAYEVLVAASKRISRTDLVCDRQACRDLLAEICNGAGA